MKKIILSIISFVALISIVFVTMIFIRIYPKHRGQATIINKSITDITDIKISICNQGFSLGSIKSKQSKTFYYEINGDSHYTIVAIFDSGKKLIKNIGYVSADYNFIDVLKIDSSTITLKTIEFYR